MMISGSDAHAHTYSTFRSVATKLNLRIMSGSSLQSCEKLQET